MSPGWVLMPVAALTLPAVAVAASSLRLAPQTGASVVTVKNAATLRSTVYRSGFGTMLIDLRKTSFPTGGTIPLTIRAGIRRTIVALPHDTCVHVVVHDQVHPFAAQLAALLDGHSTPPFSALVLFGRIYGANSGVSPDLTAATPATAVTGPTLDINFSSQGGSLYVRDYPDQQAPGYEPDWPGFAVHIDPKPTAGWRRRSATTRVTWPTGATGSCRSARGSSRSTPRSRDRADHERTAQRPAQPADVQDRNPLAASLAALAMVAALAFGLASGVPHAVAIGIAACAAERSRRYARDPCVRGRFGATAVCGP